MLGGKRLDHEKWVVKLLVNKNFPAQETLITPAEMSHENMSGLYFMPKCMK